jgi:hypothetical protein
MPVDIRAHFRFPPRLFQEFVECRFLATAVHNKGKEQKDKVVE